MGNMPGKAKYWEHFEVNGDITICKIEGCKGPRVSVRRAQKPGDIPHTVLSARRAPQN